MQEHLKYGERPESARTAERAPDEVELVAIGAGPANLALAVALEELAPELASRTLILERHEDVAWQREMLLPWSQSQVSFLKDLVTLRNPRSAFTFVNYLHSVGRLDEFVNLGSATPYRLEISNYLCWVAASLRRVRIRYGRTCASIVPRRGAHDEITGWLVHTTDGRTVAARDIVVGTGRDARVPAQFRDLPRQRVVHSTAFSSRVAELDRDADQRFVVIGGAQSAAEMLWAVHQGFPNARCTMVMRSIGLNGYESSKFTNELFYPSFVDAFHAAGPDVRSQLLREMHRSNYAGLAPAMLDALYRQLYLERLTGTERLAIRTMTEVVDAREADGEVVLTLVDRKSGRPSELRCDRVLLGTGFTPSMPKLITELAAATGLDDVTVDRAYRLQLPGGTDATCYLQGVNEATHGIADSLLSVLAARSAEIVADLLAHRDARRPTSTPTPLLARAS